MGKQIFPVVVAAGLIFAPTMVLARASSQATSLRPVALSSSHTPPTSSAHLTRHRPDGIERRSAGRTSTDVIRRLAGR